MLKKIWQKIDGYKFISGCVLSGIGGLMYFNPITAPWATEVLTVGVTTATGGLIHKKVKSNKAKSNKAENNN